ncbi:MAG: hypothetical protein JO091_07685 [Acidobacteriaceae bacterium]|nr:hypothetical protein [Acidobacteriaceae bacterium]
MKQLLTLCALGLFAAPFASAQMDDFLDIYIVRVKPEKRGDYDTFARRIAEANRKAKGDNWIAAEVEYGEGNMLYYISTRKNYAAIDAGSTAFENAIKEAYGPGGMKKMQADMNSAVAGSRSVIRRRRWDLSVNTPKDAEAYSKMVGEARWLRTIRVVVHPDHEVEFEDVVKQVKAAFEQGGTEWPLFISQNVAGEPGVVYYITTLQPSLAAFDSAPTLPKLMGEKAFLKWQKGASETEITAETTLMRFLPEQSNPPEAIVNVAPEFWKPKPMATGAKTAEAAKSAQ